MTIYDGRESFYQWDLNQKITSNTFAVGDKIHFFNMRQSNALVVKAYELDGKVVADVPNILLQNALALKVWRYEYGENSAQTIEEQIFNVEQRAQPYDYFYTETELYELRRDVMRAVEDADTAERERELAESGRKTAELDRETNETARATAENERVSAETARSSAETLRVDVESKRVTEEAKRVTAEQARVDAETSRHYAESERQSAETLRQTTFEQSYNNVANAIKGSASGEVVRVDDVSSIAHSVKAKVSSKNLFNIKAFSIFVSDTAPYISEVGDGYIVITSPQNYTSNGVSYPPIRLRNLCPNIKAGEIYTLTFDTDSVYNKLIYLSGTATALVSGKSYVFTEEMINSFVNPYGFDAGKGETGVNCTVSNIQLELGDTATEYTPYIDPTTVTVTRYGVDETDNPQTYTPEANGTIDIPSLSPTMTLLTDTAGVTIEMEYNRDANLVVADLQSQIDSLKALVEGLQG